MSDAEPKGDALTAPEHSNPIRVYNLFRITNIQATTETETSIAKLGERNLDILLAQEEVLAKTIHFWEEHFSSEDQPEIKAEEVSDERLGALLTTTLRRGDVFTPEETSMLTSLPQSQLLKDNLIHITRTLFRESLKRLQHLDSKSPLFRKRLKIEDVVLLHYLRLGLDYYHQLRDRPIYELGFDAYTRVQVRQICLDRAIDCFLLAPADQKDLAESILDYGAIGGKDLRLSNIDIIEQAVFGKETVVDRKAMADWLKEDQELQETFGLVAGSHRYSQVAPKFVVQNNGNKLTAFEKQKQENEQQAYDFLLSHFSNDFTLDTHVFDQAHALILKGVYSSYPGGIVRSYESGVDPFYRIKFDQPEEIDIHTYEVCQWFNHLNVDPKSPRSIDELADIVSRLHHRLIKIHRYPNGNGRLARTFVKAFLKVAAGQELTFPRRPYLDAVRKDFLSEEGGARNEFDVSHFSDFITCKL